MNILYTISRSWNWTQNLTLGRFRSWNVSVSGSWNRSRSRSRSWGRSLSRRMNIKLESE